MNRLLALLLAGLIGSCATTPDPTFSSTWPERPGEFESIHKAWTRKGSVRQDFDKVLEVYATYMSPEWRSAWAAWRADTERMSAAQRAELLAAEKAAHAAANEFELLVSTHEDEENDLSRGPRSMWRVVMVDAAGTAYPAIEIHRDRRSREALRTEFPNLGDFATAYVARFPATVDLFANDARRFSLRITSTRGSVELVWNR